MELDHINIHITFNGDIPKIFDLKTTDSYYLFTSWGPIRYSHHPNKVFINYNGLEGEIGDVTITKESCIKTWWLGSTHRTNVMLQIPEDIHQVLSTLKTYYLYCFLKGPLGVKTLEPFNTFIHISGCPGAGKTHLANKIKALGRDVTVIDTDDRYEYTDAENRGYLLSLKGIVVICGITFKEVAMPRLFCKHKFYIFDDYKKNYMQLQRRSFKSIKSNLGNIEDDLDKGEITPRDYSLFRPFLDVFEKYIEGNKKYEYVHSDYEMLTSDEIYERVVTLIDTL